MKELTRFRKSALILANLTVFAVGCGPMRDPESESKMPKPIRYQVATERCCGGAVYLSRATGYYPANTKLQGGYKDRLGKKLRTLQDFLDGRANYVSVAMDSTILPYGTNLCIPSLNDAHNDAIRFRVVDTGGAFKNKGISRIDICTDSKKDSQAESVNQSLEIVVCDR